MLKLLFCMAVCTGIHDAVPAPKLPVSVELPSQTVLLLNDFTTDLGHARGDSIRKDLPSKLSLVNIGFKMGFNATGINFNKGYSAPPVPVETLWRTGLVLGLSVEIPIYQRLWLQQDYLYSQMGGEVTKTGVVYRFHYISLPAILKYKLSRRMAFGAGPQFDILVQAREKTNGSSLNIMHDTEERSIGAVAGVDLVLFKNIRFEARYMYGLNHVGIHNQAPSNEFKYKMAQLAVCVRFGAPSLGNETQ